MFDVNTIFITKLSDLVSKNRAGKNVLNLPTGSRVVKPVEFDDTENRTLVAISNEGRMLAFPVSDLPELSRGKGNKIIGIPSARLQAREEFMIGLVVMNEKQKPEFRLNHL